MSYQAPPDIAEKNSKLYGMLCHLLALSALIGVPFGNILGPLVMWLVKRDEYPFVDDQGKESLNFQISLMIYSFLSLITIVGIVLVPVIIIFGLVMVIIASVQAGDGVRYRYPLTIRFIN